MQPEKEIGVSIMNLVIKEKYHGQHEFSVNRWIHSEFLYSMLVVSNCLPRFINCESLLNVIGLTL